MRAQSFRLIAYLPKYCKTGYIQSELRCVRGTESADNYESDLRFLQVAGIAAVIAAVFPPKISRAAKPRMISAVKPVKILALREIFFSVFLLR